MGNFKFASILYVLLATLIFSGCQNQSEPTPVEHHEHFPDLEHFDDDFESLFEPSNIVSPYACLKATAAQIEEINRGNLLRSEFLTYCHSQTAGSSWCDQLVRPNPDSRSTFRCTYGVNQPHRLIHPDKATWQFAAVAVQIIKELQAKGIRVSTIYNWWRPEPYNSNVGGSPTRHPYGTAIDVRFATKSNQEKAFVELCNLRKAGRIRAVGYYPGTGLHFGVGDSIANTWGKSCP